MKIAASVPVEVAIFSTRRAHAPVWGVCAEIVRISVRRSDTDVFSSVCVDPVIREGRFTHTRHDALVRPEAGINADVVQVA